MLAEDKLNASSTQDHEEEPKEQKEPSTQKPTTTVGPNATVLKPRSATQPKSGGLVLKTPSEKPSLVSKPAAPLPAKSPWATLPPVEKVPPIAINPEPEAPLPRPSQPEPAVTQPTAPPSNTAMEIPADSFTRSRGDAPNGSVGQLYNAQSGRYEPANTGRRGSIRKDQNFRPPSVLQRGSYTEQRGPAEPSSAFQTRSGGQLDSSLWTRRGSSNASGESGAPGRRPSFSKGLPNGLNDERRDSQHSQALQSPSTPSLGHSVAVIDGSPAQQAAQLAGQSPAIQHAQLADVRSATSSPLQVRDEAAAQKLLMKEKRDAAIKRKKDEELREETAKRERIRLKMESLGMEPPPEKKDEAKDEPKKPAERKSIEQPSTDEKHPEKVTRNVEPTKVDSKTVKDKAEVLKAPPKPPLPDASGATQQYGMIKVHGATSTTVAQAELHRTAQEKAKSQVSTPVAHVSGPQQSSTPAEKAPSPLVNGVKPSEPALVKTSEATPSNAFRDSRQQPWNDIPKDQKMLAAWSNQTSTRDAPTNHNNVWGAPGQSRPLGNGTFDRASQRSQPRQQDQFSSPNLAPIGPPKPNPPSRDARDTVKSTELTGTSSLDDGKAMTTSADSNASSSRLDVVGRTTSTDDRPLPPHLAHGFPPRSHYTSLENKGTGLEQQKSSLAAWGNFHATATHEEAVKRQQHTVRLAEEARTGVRHEPQLPTMNETWRQVKVDDQLNQRSVVNVSRAQNAHGQAPELQFGLKVQDAAFSAQASPTPPTQGGMGRGSRFFPTAGRAGLHAYAQPVPFTPGFRRGSSPPPPDSDSHPAFIRDQPLPRVSLPLVGPKPKVRLPPSMASPVQAVKKAETLVPQAPPASQPKNPSWQDRINGLLAPKKSSPERAFANPAPSNVTSGFSATKEPLASPVMRLAAAVSLPPHSEELSSLSSLKVETKDVIDEEALFTPESGSLPVASLPPSESRNAIQTTKAWKNGPPSFMRLSKNIEAASKEAYIEVATMGNGGPMVFIRLKGMSIPRSKTMTISSGQIKSETINPIQQAQPRTFSGTSKTGKVAPKSRQPSGNFNPGLRPHQNAYPRSVQHGGPPSQIPAKVPSMNGTVWGQTFVR